ncbi:hypothetical protein Btru_014330 [Bulinus truncatus]|nr:hypothetical protein Btru_014330 [Bulinus truncatus]
MFLAKRSNILFHCFLVSLFLIQRHEVMSIILLYGSHLLVVLVILISETTTLFEKECPPARAGECRTDMDSETYYAIIYSRTFCVSYLCDTKTDGGGWIVIQRRVYRDIYFNKLWADYKHGFGSICKDFWIGNKNIHRMTNSAKYELRIDMEYRQIRYFAQYSDFYIEDEAQNYRLHIENFKGNTFDDFMNQNDLEFTTFDRDNDRMNDSHCGVWFTTGWWFGNCHTVNLNGHFNLSHFHGQGVNWFNITGYYNTLTFAEMKIRKINNG